MQGVRKYDSRYAQSMLTGFFFEDNVELQSKIQQGEWTDNILPT